MVVLLAVESRCICLCLEYGMEYSWRLGESNNIYILYIIYIIYYIYVDLAKNDSPATTKPAAASVSLPRRRSSCPSSLHVYCHRVCPRSFRAAKNTSPLRRWDVFFFCVFVGD